MFKLNFFISYVKSTENFIANALCRKLNYIFIRKNNKLMLRKTKKGFKSIETLKNI